MARDLIVLRDSARSGELHPIIYVAIAGLASWFVLSVWSFASDGYTDYLLAVVSGFIVIFVALPFVLSMVTREDGGTEPHRSFRGWAECEFDTWQYRLKCRNAAIEILLPPAAIAFSMTAFGIVLLLVERGAI